VSQESDPSKVTITLVPDGEGCVVTSVHEMDTARIEYQPSIRRSANNAAVFTQSKTVRMQSRTPRSRKRLDHAGHALLCNLCRSRSGNRLTSSMPIPSGGHVVMLIALSYGCSAIVNQIVGSSGVSERRVEIHVCFSTRP
jgi:hypothetical protein